MISNIDSIKVVRVFCVHETLSRFVSYYWRMIRYLDEVSYRLLRAKMITELEVVRVLVTETTDRLKRTFGKISWGLISCRFEFTWIQIQYLEKTTMSSSMSTLRFSVMSLKMPIKYPSHLLSRRSQWSSEHMDLNLSSTTTHHLLSLRVKELRYDLTCIDPLRKRNSRSLMIYLNVCTVISRDMDVVLAMECRLRRILTRSSWFEFSRFRSDDHNLYQSFRSFDTMMTVCIEIMFWRVEILVSDNFYFYTDFILKI